MRDEIEGLIRAQTLVSRVMVTPPVPDEIGVVAEANGVVAEEELVDAF
jgi:hypothetical protein